MKVLLPAPVSLLCFGVPRGSRTEALASLGGVLVL
jgi:hypothetical protein